jgi:hypothetical protein
MIEQNILRHMMKQVLFRPPVPEQGQRIENNRWIVQMMNINRENFNNGYDLMICYDKSKYDPHGEDDIFILIKIENTVYLSSPFSNYIEVTSREENENFPKDDFDCFTYDTLFRGIDKGDDLEELDGIFPLEIVNEIKKVIDFYNNVGGSGLRPMSTTWHYILD